MIVVLVNWFYIIITTYLTGNACMRLLERLFRRGKGSWLKTPFYDLFAGIMCTTCYAQIYSLFGGVGLEANIGLLAFCLVYAVLFGGKEAGELGGWLHERNAEMPSIMKKGLICVMVLGTAAYALATSGAPKLIDTDWYHAQTIRWIEEYGCVTGVANLFHSLGFNSAQHYFDALYSMKAVFGVSLHATGGYFGLLLLFHGLVRLAGWKAHRRHIADGLALAEVVYTVIVTAFFADPYTDTLPNCLVFFILTEWISLLETEEKEDFPYAFLCIFGVFATVVKTSVVMVALLVIQPAVRLIRDRSWGKIAGYILTGILIAVPFFITNVRVTGYLVYLASAIDLFDVPWKIDIGIVRYSVDSMIHDARAFDAPWDEVLHNGLAWVPTWFRNDSVSHRILYLAVCFLLAFDIVGTVLSAFHKASRLADSGRRNTVELPMLLPRLVVIIGLIYCFLTIPQVRYCWVFLLFPLVVVPAIYLEKFRERSRIGKCAVVTATAVGGAVLLMFAGFYSLRTIGYILDAVPDTLVRQADYQRYEMKPAEKGGHTFYVREEGGAIVCGYYVFPYLNEEELLDVLVTGDALSDGFCLDRSTAQRSENRGTYETTAGEEGSNENTWNSQRITEVKTFVNGLYEAMSNRDLNRIREGLDDDAAEDWVTRLVTLYSDDIGFGFQRYEDVEVKAYDISDGDYFVAYAAYDLVIDWNGGELALPGISSFLIRQNDYSRWCITSGNDLPDELEDRLEMELLQTYGSDEIYYWYNDISAEYNDIIVNTLGLSDRIAKVNNEAVHWIGSGMASEAFREKGAWDYFFGEESGLLTASLNGEEDSVDSIYIVQKGDCLWSIAERKMGDGMYWAGLYEANRDVIGESPDLLWIGTELDLTYVKD